MCLHIKYVCPSCRHPISDKTTDSGEACQLSMMFEQLNEHEFNLRHANLTFRETIPLTIGEAQFTNYVCQTRGCTYHPDTEFTSGFHPEFGPMARCPGCDNIFSVATNALDDQMIGGLQRLLSHRADARVPILANHLWPGYHCTAENNGCLWAGDVLSHVTKRLDAIRAYMKWTPPDVLLENPVPQELFPRVSEAQPNVLPANPPPQRLYAYEEGEQSAEAAAPRTGNPPPHGEGRQVEAAPRRPINAREPWSAEDIERLKLLKANYFSGEEIAADLGRTPQAVWTKLRDLRRADEASKSKQ